MKIAIIDLLFKWPPDGGARIDVWRLLEFLGRTHDVRLFCPYIPDDPFGRGNTSAMNAEETSRIESIHCTSGEFIDGTFLEALNRQVEDFGPDRVIVTDGWHYKPFVINKLARFKPIVRQYAHEMLCLKGHGHRYRDGGVCDLCFLNEPPSFEVCRSCMKHWHKNTSTDVFDLEIKAAGLPDNADYAGVVKQAFEATSAVIMYNQREAERIAPFCSRVVISPGACESELFTRQSGNHFPKDDTRLRFVVSGRCADYLKGLHVVKSAAAELAQVTNTSFVIEYTGEGEETDYLKPLGWLPREEVLNRIQNADLTIHPSVWPEPFGMAALESIALGVPVVASDHGGLGDLVRDTGGGWTFAHGDHLDLAGKLHEIMKSPDRLRSAALEGRENARAYTWERVFEESYLPLLK